jgi:Zn-dependent protease with chaperone function
MPSGISTVTTQPDSIPPGLPTPTTAPKPSRHYAGRAWLAVGGLLVFMLLYLGLAGWFLLTACHLMTGSMTNGDDAFVGYLAGACAVFLAAFMLKGLFFVKRGSVDGMFEIKAEQQPALFRFLYQMADAAGAPRPHRVFLSARVNASVSYDLSILNLLIPSRKNLEIGLGLVNVLTLGELRAVLAHEFGHFAQRSMAVGRWVYIAQQVAGHLVARRDRFDRFLQGLSRSDVRVAWVGWLISLIVWAIRSLVDSTFRVVVLMQRALSREMELNADLVAVHLTGSDALVHALHRLQAADDSWDRALRFSINEHESGYTPRDMFAVQSRILTLMRQILNDPGYGVVAPVPAEQPDRHRVFTAGLAQPPRMWLTHPLNHEREANAKQRYIPSPLDDAGAWTVFQDAETLRAHLTAMTLRTTDSVPVSGDDTLAHLNDQFTREHLQSRYRGIYLGRSSVRHAQYARDLYDDNVAADRATCDLLYPASLTQDMERLRTLELDLQQLQGLSAGTLKVEGGKIRHRGGESALSELPALLAAAQRDLDAVQGRLRAHDVLCRSWHAAAARQAGGAWPTYLQSLLLTLHYADHAEADLRDAQGWFSNRVAIETATRHVSAAGRKRVLQAASALYETLKQAYEQRNQVHLGSDLAQRLGYAGWPEELGRLGLEPPTPQNLGNWLNVAGRWVDKAANTLGALRGRALEALLVAESQLAAHVVRQSPLEDPAGTPTQVTATYTALLPGKERQRQTRLSWWGRFQTADGMLPSVSRLAVAGAIVAVVLGVGLMLGSASVQIYNGMAQTVVVKIGDKVQVRVPPHSSANRALDAGHGYPIETRTADGRLVEAFQGELQGRFSHMVYNVAGASPLAVLTVAYGNASPRPPHRLGSPRWSASDADVLFAEPPETISTKGGGGTRTVLRGVEDAAPGQMMALVSDGQERTAMILAHASWDATADPHTMQWLSLASSSPGFSALLKQRLQAAPDDMVLRRFQIDTAPDAERQTLCNDYRQRAVSAPTAPIEYLAIRCQPPSDAKDQSYVDAQRRWPEDPWLANAAGYVAAEHGQWAHAQPLLRQAYGALPPLAPSIAVDLARIMRLRGQADALALGGLARQSEELGELLTLETGQQLGKGDSLQAYPALARGKLDDALRLSGTDKAAATRALRLVAASDGATADVVQRALALPVSEGLDPDTLWASIALSARSKHDYSELLAHAPRWEQQHVPVMRTFLDSVLQGRPKDTSEGLLNGLPPELRGQAFAMAVVVLGKHAPRAWRNAARALLFASERPYFAPG